MCQDILNNLIFGDMDFTIRYYGIPVMVKLSLNYPAYADSSNISKSMQPHICIIIAVIKISTIHTTLRPHMRYKFKAVQ